MKRSPVRSGTISSIGYNPESRILEIEFTEGGIYHYYKVPFSEYQGIMSARSHGRYFTSHIRDMYSYEKVN